MQGELAHQSSFRVQMLAFLGCMCLNHWEVLKPGQLAGEAAATVTLHWHCPEWQLQLLYRHVSTATGSAAILQSGGAYSRKEGACYTAAVMHRNSTQLPTLPDSASLCLAVGLFQLDTTKQTSGC